MWKLGEAVSWRGIYRERVWHAQTTIVVKDTSDEIVLALLPGTECIAPEGYLNGKASNKRRWNFKERYWETQNYLWRTNRLLLSLEPEKYYSIMHFWDQASNKFSCYYVNFQLPFKRGHNTVDTLDLDLDMIVNPDLSFVWKDEDDYRKAIDHGIILPEWVAGIEDAKHEIFEKLAKRQYPFDGAWLNWVPDPNWEPPKLPANWDKI